MGARSPLDSRKERAYSPSAIAAATGAESTLSARSSSRSAGSVNRLASTVAPPASGVFFKMFAMRLLAAASTPASGFAERAQAGLDVERRARRRREDRFDHFRRRAVASLEQEAAQALPDEGLRLGGGGGAPHGLQRRAMFEQSRQIEVESAFEQDAQDAERRAPEAERVLGTGRLLIDREDADQCVELVGDAECLARLAHGQCVAGEPREVLLLEREGKFRGFALDPRVIAAHRALQFRKFGDHRGHEIRLGERRRTVHEGTRADARADFPGERPHPRGLIRVAAEFRLEGDAG